jgi:hypothetical protein
MPSKAPAEENVCLSSHAVDAAAIIMASNWQLLKGSNIASTVVRDNSCLAAHVCRMPWGGNGLTAFFNHLQQQQQQRACI